MTNSTSHRISLFGQRLSYPAANFAAVVVLFLALVGLAVIVIAVASAVRELTASRRFVRSLAAADPVPLEDAWVFRDERPQAFCAGLLRPQMYISSGTLTSLDEPAVAAVLAHERHHMRRRDPLRLATGRVLTRALFFVPGRRELFSRQLALAELSADESAVHAAPGNRSGLARAMLNFSPGSRPGVGIDPTRVDHLLGEPPSWRFPVLLCLAGLSLLALMTAVAVLAGQVASGSATLAPPFLSSQPCIVVLALMPAALGLVVFVLKRRRSGRAPASLA